MRLSFRDCTELFQLTHPTFHLSFDILTNKRSTNCSTQVSFSFCRKTIHGWSSWYFFFYSYAAYTHTHQPCTSNISRVYVMRSTSLPNLYVYPHVMFHFRPNVSLPRTNNAHNYAQHIKEGLGTEASIIVWYSAWHN